MAIYDPGKIPGISLALADEVWGIAIGGEKEIRGGCERDQGEGDRDHLRRRGVGNAGELLKNPTAAYSTPSPSSYYCLQGGKA